MNATYKAKVAPNLTLGAPARHPMQMQKEPSLKVNLLPKIFKMPNTVKNQESTNNSKWKISTP